MSKSKSLDGSPSFSLRKKRKSSTNDMSRQSISPLKATGAFKIVLGGEDLTPDPLHPLTYEGVYSQSLKEAALEGVTKSHSVNLASRDRFSSELQRQTVYAESIFRQSFISTTYIEDIVIEPEKVEVIREESEEAIHADVVPGLETLNKMPTNISLTLVETPTIFLFELPSKTVEKGSDEAPAIEAENERYLYLTEGKGRNRKVVNVEVQTVEVLLKARSTDAPKFERKNSHAFASNWEMYDTYKAYEATGEAAVEEFGIEEDDIGGHNPKEAFKQIESIELAVISHEEQMTKLLKNSKFKQAVCIVERLLANNNFNEQQKRFRGLSDPDPFREEIEYKYRLNLLWTFANKETYGHCVSAICWNEANTDLLAVAYGKFFYSDRTSGMVFVWNIKNPVQPERSYRFDEPVSTLDFSKNNPNLLAIGLFDGTIFVIDISNVNLQLIARSGPDSPSFDPFWQVKWQEGSDYHKGEEMLVATNEDGRILQYRLKPSIYLLCSHLMRITQPEGKLKGIEVVRKCHVSGIPVTRYAAGLVVTPHPVDPDVYYVGTNEGTIHKCSRSHFNQHLDVFLAHDGATYCIKFSPFCNRIFLTCGDDWNVRIWADGIFEPLFELTKTMNSVQDADWNPIHSTIIANICGTDIYIWDIQRKTHQPQSITRSPTNSRNTVVQFIKSGRCLVVGDIDGNIHIFSLEDMPFPAFFQDDLLTTSITRGLVTRPDLIKRLKKFRNLNFTCNYPEKDK